MLGAIVGDIIGSIYEFNNHLSKEFPLFGGKCKFTDDTVLTVAVADCLMSNGNYAKYIKNYARKYTGRGYGGRFRQWISSDSLEPYNSWGNGSAMRVSAVGFAFDDLKSVVAESKRSAEVTHNHPVYIFNESCQETVPEAIIAFLESTDFEDAIRNAVSLGGDTDTLTCITGGIAEAFYGGVPTAIADKALSYLDDNMRTVVENFYGSLSQSKAN